MEKTTALIIGVLVGVGMQRTTAVRGGDEIVVTNKIFEKYCITIVIIFMSVPTTYVSLVLSDLFLDIIVAKI